jgi:hypothetical protein
MPHSTIQPRLPAPPSADRAADLVASMFTTAGRLGYHPAEVWGDEWWSSTGEDV